MFSIKDLKTITQSALTLSLCIILSCITIFKMPYGGSVTLGHTAPLILFAFKNGAKLGFFLGLVSGILQIVISFHIPPAKSFTTFAFVVLLDYIIPYALVGIAPLYAKTIKNKKKSVVVGAIISNLLRLACNVISGVLIWGEYVTKGVDVWIYSLAYNSLYIVPETIITAIICYTFMNFILPPKSL